MHYPLAGGPFDDHILCRAGQEQVEACTHSIAVIAYFLQITAEDISHMSKQTLYKFGIETFEDAKIILEHAKRGKTVRPRTSSSGNTKSKFYWYTLVLQVSFGQMDPVTEGLFGVHLG